MNYIPDAISVVIPTYNRAHLIKASIQSVLDQTLQPYEIIIVDDFSTDNTEEVVNSFNSPLIKYVKNQRKKGANGARNTGILMAKGEFIAFHDSDDIFLKDKLKLQYDVLSTNQEIDICFCSLLRENKGKSEVYPYKFLHKNEIYNLLKFQNWISTQTIVIRSKLAREKLFDESLMRFQDWDFVLRCILCENVYHLHKPLVVQRVSLDSITSNSSYLDAYKIIFKKYPDLKNHGIYNRVISQELKFKKNNSIFNLIILFVLKVLRKIDFIFSRIKG